MKVTVKCEVEYSFPILMEAEETGLIVLFTSEIVGAVINGGSSIWFVGEYYDDWVSCYQKNHWKKFTGTITLGND